MIQTGQTGSFLKHRIVLNCPTTDEIWAAYDHLPATGQIQVSCALTELVSALHLLEAAGFFGMTVLSGQALARGVQIVAHRGSNAACYDSGKAACYRGGALAVLDDDNHLLFGETRICEKTAQIYRLPTYRRWLEVSHGNPDLISLLDTDPVAFDCDTFEADAAKLAESIPDSLPPEQSLSMVLYPGPFKTLILHDGTVLLRGVPAHVPGAIARGLAKTDACVLLANGAGIQAAAPTNFKEAYRKHGAICLTEEPRLQTLSGGIDMADLSILDETPAEMKNRLLKTIASRAAYFIMTGSDARDVDGCCPSDGVKAANLLVEAGLLQVARPNSSPDACPVNIYAFAGEIRSHGNKPEFHIDPPFREEVKSHIRNGRPETPAWMRILRWPLLLFVLLSLGTMAGNAVTGDRSAHRYSGIESVDALGLPFQTGTAVLLFHRSQRCPFCTDMEAHTRAALDASFSEELQAGSLAFRLVDMGRPRSKNLVQKFGLFTSSVVLIELQEQKIAHWRVFAAAWDLTERRQAFMKEFRAALLDFRQGTDD